MQQQGGGSQYGASPTEMAAAAGSATDPGKSMLAGSIDHNPHHHHHQQFKLRDPSLAAAEVEGEVDGEAEAASPISSRPPTIAHSSTGSFEEIVVVPAGRGGLMPDEDTLVGGVEDADRAGGGGNRWPRPETLALIKIRSDMDAAFRDATLKAPLWEDVSRKLAELGYKRSAKKCKEKFENVHKYYKRTKEGRAGRQDGKSYRFFSQLEALGATNTTSSSYMSSAAAASSLSHQQQLVAAPLSAASIGIGITNPTPVVSSIRIPPLTAAASAALPEAPIPLTSGTTNLAFPPYPSTAAGTTAPPPATGGGGGVSFSSDSFSSSSGSEEEEELDEEGEAAEEPMEVDVEGEQTSSRHHRLKRKRGSSKLGTSSSSQWMMEFFDGLMKQVMQKQEAMQQRFLETIEKREQDRMIREEAWKRQEMARLVREHDLMARERTMSASRDAAIIAFLQKITGQTIQLPLPPVSISAAPPPPPPTVPNSPPPPPQQQSSSSPSQRQHHKTQPNQQHQHHQQQQKQPPHYQQQQNQQQLQQQQQQRLHHHPYHPPSVEVVKPHQQNISSEVIMAAVPEQQVPPQEIILSGGASLEASPSSSSRWPKAEVLALIRLRSGLESRYQEAGPKGPLWEEISAGMLRMGYKRNAKRCKEKWENINKYFKKVKESNKARPADSKTCPYFRELDELYQKKILGSGFSSSDNMPEQQHLHQQETFTSTMDPIPPPTSLPQDRTDVQTTTPPSQLTTQAENKKGISSSDLQTSNGGLTKVLFGEGSCSSGGGGADHTGVNKPEDIMKEQRQKQQIHGLLIIDCDKTEEPDSDNLDQDEDEEEEDEEEEEEDYDEEEMKMAYKIEFQRQNAGSLSGGGNGAPPFLAIVR